MFEALIAGFALGGSLIVAIGAQNAFVIRQGVLGQHVFWVCAFCALCDALLIWGGVLGLGLLIQAFPGLVPLMTYGGAAFLFVYGCFALRRALSPSAMREGNNTTPSLRAALLACAGFTLLNPHVYLDTVILVGSIANARPRGEAAPFAAGATVASIVWFFSLGYGAAALRPWLAKPSVWRWIDALIALVLFALALKLVLGS